MIRQKQMGCWFLIGFVIAFPVLAVGGADDNDNENQAVAGYADFPLLGGPAALGTERLQSIPYDDLLKPFDINQDLSLNDLDIQQFESIVDSVNGSDLTGLQIAGRFRNIQKNQKESFLALYDLDRDGYFSFKDVKLFTDVIDQLDESGTKGRDLVRKYELKLSAQEED